MKPFFQLAHVPAGQTNSDAFVDLMIISVPPIPAGASLLLDFDASVEITPGPAAGVFQGAEFRFVWDGVPLPDDAFVEIDTQIASNFNTWSAGVRFRSLVPAGVIAHVLTVQWRVFDTSCTANTFAGSGTLTVQEVHP